MMGKDVYFFSVQFFASSYDFGCKSYVCMVCTYAPSHVQLHRLFTSDQERANSSVSQHKYTLILDNTL